MIRRKKCDETRPACLQCASTTRTCDFLEPLLSQTFQSRSDLSISLSKQPYSLLSINPREVVHFDYFRTNFTEFSVFFNDTVWKQLILQAMHEEPFVLNAVIGIGALRRSQLESGQLPLEKGVPLSIVEYSIRKYDRTSKELSYQLITNTADWRLAVLGSIVFLAVEVL